MKLLGTAGLTKLIQLIKSSFISNTDTVTAQTVTLANVATSGSYNDLTNTPTIPTVNNPTISITQGGVSKGSFTLNQATGDTIALDAGGGNYTAGTGIDITNDVITAEGVADQNDTTTAIKTWTGTKAEYKVLLPATYYAYENDYTAGDLLFTTVTPAVTDVELYRVSNGQATYVGTIDGENYRAIGGVIYDQADNSFRRNSSYDVTLASQIDNDTLYNVTDDNTADAYEAYAKSEVYTKSEVQALLSAQQSAFEDELYYKSGDTYTITPLSALHLNGCLTSSKSQIIFSIALPKRLDNVSTVSVSGMTAGVRAASGGYIIALNTDITTVGTLEATKAADNYVTIVISLTTSASSYTNNITTNAQITYLSLSFS